MKFYSYIINKISEGSSRSVIIKKNIAWSLLIKALGMSTSFLLIPITLNVMSVEKYGIWITLFTIVNWFNLMNFGIGNGFRNKFTEAIALGKTEKARNLVETLYGSTSIIALCLFVIYFFLYPYLDWMKILNLSNNFDENISSIVLNVFVLFLLQFVFKNINTVLLALQKTALSNFISFSGNCLALLLIILLGNKNLSSLHAISLIFMISPLFVYIIASILLFRKELSNYIPLSLKINKKLFKSMMGLGVKFFIIQITTIVMFTSGNFIISHLFSPAEVTPYNISYTLFASVIGVFTVVITPFWSAYTDAIANEDYQWIKRILKKLNKIWLLFLFVIIVVLIFSPFIYDVWIGDKLSISFNLSLSFALYAAIYAWTGMFSKFLNGVGKIQIQLYLSFFQCLSNIPLAIFLVKYIDLGPAGVILATNLNLLLTAVVLPIQVHKISSQTDRGLWSK